jgi:hypothetical protein
VTSTIDQAHLIFVRSLTYLAPSKVATAFHAFVNARSASPRRGERIVDAGACIRPRIESHLASMDCQKIVLRRVSARGCKYQLELVIDLGLGRAANCWLTDQ